MRPLPISIDIKKNVAGALALLAGAFSLYALWQGLDSVLLGGADTGWLIRTGDYISASGKLPTHDIFTWTQSSRLFICYQWLFELAVSALCKAGGLNAVGAIAFMLISILYLFAMPLLWLQQGVKPAYTAICMALVLTPFWFFARPQLISFWAAFVCLLILEHWRKNNQSRAIFGLPPLTLLWANCHCLALLSPLLSAVYLLGACFGRDTSVTEGQNNSAKREIAPLLVVMLLSLGAAFLMPFDLRTILIAIGVFAHTDVNACNELRPLYLTSYLLQPCNLFVLAVFALLVVRRRRIPLCGFVISFAAIIAGLAVARLQPLGVLLSWPFLGLALAAPPNLTSSRSSLRIAPPLWLLAVLALSLSLWWSRFPLSQNGDPALEHFLGSRPALVLAATRLKAGDHLFTDTLSGSRLIFLKGPPVFIDGRFFVFDQAFCREWLTVMNLAIPWPRFADKWSLDSVVLSHGYPLYHQLMGLPEWRLCLDDGGTSVWIKADSASLVQARLGLDPEKPEVLGLSADQLSSARIALAAKHLQSAEVYYSRGSSDQALAEVNLSLAQVNTDKARALKEKLDQHLVK